MQLSLLSFALRWRETDWSCCISPSHQSPSPAAASTWSCRKYKLLMTVTPLPHKPMLPKILVPGWSVCAPPASCDFLWRRGSSSDGSEEQLHAPVSHHRASHFTLGLHHCLEPGDKHNTTAVFSPCLSPFLCISFYPVSPCNISCISFYPASPCNISFPLPLTCPLKSSLSAHSRSRQSRNKHSCLVHQPQLHHLQYLLQMRQPHGWAGRTRTPASEMTAICADEPLHQWGHLLSVSPI